MSRGPTAAVVASALLATLWLPTAALADHQLPTWSEYHGAVARSTGWLAWSRADLEAAEKAALAAVRLQPNDGPSLLLLTGVLVERERWMRANEAAALLGDLKERSPEALLLMGRISLELGHWNQAKEHYQEAARRSPDDARGHLGLALLAARQSKDWPSMQRHLRQARDIEPKFHAATLPLLRGWTSLSDDKDFLDALEAVLNP